MSDHVDFDPQAYGPVFAELLQEKCLNPLDAGRPNTTIRPALDALTVDRAFADHSIVDRDMATSCLSAVWLYHNYLDESHTISQSVETSTGSYWHGIMHRREPDFPNAKYWFRRVGSHPVFESLTPVAASLAEETEAHPSTGFLTLQSLWDPFAFVDLCEAVLRGRSPAEDLCRRIQEAEWRLLFDYSYHRAIGSA